MSERNKMQAAGTHPAPCARHCESTAYEIEIRRLRAELSASREREARMRDAAEQVIEMNRQHAKAMFGFSEKADSYPMVICLRDALAEGAQGANHG